MTTRVQETINKVKPLLSSKKQYSNLPYMSNSFESNLMGVKHYFT